ncbi:MAG: hypothetical protein DRN00_04160 [Thermoplasmata archaeon]|nr:MAG: hypothetical protein DRN00_04160 [Thermoplasmata archaeon]
MQRSFNLDKDLFKVAIGSFVPSRISLHPRFSPPKIVSILRIPPLRIVANLYKVFFPPLPQPSNTVRI